jgi:hypothetical protein
MVKPEESRSEYAGNLVSDVVKREIEERTRIYFISRTVIISMAILVSTEDSIRLSVATQDHLEVIANQNIHRYAP